MRGVWAYAKVMLSVLVAVAGAVVHRLFRGPLVPGWTWEVELVRAALAAMVRSGGREASTDTWAGLKLSSPLPRPLRLALGVEPGTAGGVPGEWIRRNGQETTAPRLLYFHGGGYVMGSPSMERAFIGTLTWSAGSETFAVDYRLAPRHRFPAAVDDAVAAYLAMVENGFDSARMVVGGDSAGGGLASALMVRLRDEGRPLPAGAVLFSPWVDLANTASTLVSNRATDYLPAVIDRPALEYLGGVDPTHPHASPLYADLTGLPPLLIFAGGREMILEDSTRLADRAARAGVDVTLHVEPTMYHVWPAVLPKHPASLRSVALAGAWIRRISS